MLSLIQLFLQLCLWWAKTCELHMKLPEVTGFWPSGNVSSLAAIEFDCVLKHVEAHHDKMMCHVDKMAMILEYYMCFLMTSPIPSLMLCPRILSFCLRLGRCPGPVPSFPLGARRNEQLCKWTTPTQVGYLGIGPTHHQLSHRSQLVS